jgi:hypothetical protein
LGRIKPIELKKQGMWNSYNYEKTIERFDIILKDGKSKNERRKQTKFELAEMKSKWKQKDCQILDRKTERILS